MIDKLLECFCDFTDFLMNYEEEHPYKFSLIISVISSLVTNLIILVFVWLLSM